MLDQRLAGFVDNPANRKELLDAHEVRAGTIDSFIATNPGAIDYIPNGEDILSKRFDSSSFVESRTPTDKFNFDDHETPSCGEHPTFPLVISRHGPNLFSPLSSHGSSQIVRL